MLNPLAKAGASAATDLTVGNEVSLRPPEAGYWTRRGVAYIGKSEGFLTSPIAEKLRGKVSLIFTSPPFPLNRKKRYGNEQGDAFTAWLARFAPLFRQLLTPEGSVVLEMGNAWEPGRPVMSTLALEALLEFRRQGNFNLCQQFICYNPARLPSPAQWVNVERIRLKDSYTHLWWMAPSEKPYADNRRILKPYSEAMRKLLASRKYNSGNRPSEHHIGRDRFCGTITVRSPQTSSRFRIRLRPIRTSDTVACMGCAFIRLGCRRAFQNFLFAF